MTWIDMPHHHVTHYIYIYILNIYLLVMECKISVACHDKNKCHDLIIIIFLDFLNKIFWRYSLHHHTCFVYHIYTWYINVYTHYVHWCTHSLRVQPQTSCKCTKVFTTKPLQFFDKIKRKFNFVIFDMKLFLKFKLKHTFSFSKFIQMLQMKTWSWNLFNNLSMKIIIVYNYAIKRIKKNLKWDVMNRKKFTNIFCVNSSTIFINGIEFNVNSKV